MLLYTVQERWTIQELADCVEGSVTSCDFDNPCLNLVSHNSNKKHILATLHIKYMLGGNLLWPH